MLTSQHYTLTCKDNKQNLSLVCCSYTSTICQHCYNEILYITGSVYSFCNRQFLIYRILSKYCSIMVWYGVSVNSCINHLNFFKYIQNMWVNIECFIWFNKETDKGDNSYFIQVKLFQYISFISKGFSGRPTVARDNQWPSLCKLKPLVEKYLFWAVARHFCSFCCLKHVLLWWQN